MGWRSRLADLAAIMLFAAVYGLGLCLVAGVVGGCAFPGSGGTKFNPLRSPLSALIRPSGGEVMGPPVPTTEDQLQAKIATAERELELLRATRALDAEKAMQANARWVNKWAGILWLAGIATAAASFFVPVIPRGAALAGVGLGFVAWGTGYVLLRWGAMLATWGFIVSLVGLLIAGAAWVWPIALAYYRRHIDKTADELAGKGHHDAAVALEVVAGTVPFAARKARLAELAGVTT